MILFAADDHYGSRPGANLYERIKGHYDIRFHENDWSCFEDAALMGDCSLLVLNLIAGTGDVEMPGPKAETQVRAYVEGGRPLLLLHGASAAFWHWDWWRPIVGHRWVRGNDPDGMPPSTHPKRPFTVAVAKSRHPLCSKLQSMDLPEDEIYTDLEQTCPATTLMQTTTDEGTFVQCYETTTPWSGAVIGFLPGHRSDVVARDDMVANCRVLIDYLLP